MDEQINLKQIGSRIRAARSSKGMSQADLAVKASVSLPLISNIELGKTRMHLDTFIKVAEALQVSKLSIRVNSRIYLKAVRPVKWRPFSTSLGK